MIVVLIVRNKSSKISDKTKFIALETYNNWKEKEKINCVLRKTAFFTTIRRCAVESTEKRLYLLCKYKKQTCANLPNSGVNTKVCSAFMSFVEPESKT